jgi:predicted RNase H-like nuclease (RuvC/YqgF family)
MMDNSFGRIKKLEKENKKLLLEIEELGEAYSKIVTINQRLEDENERLEDENEKLKKELEDLKRPKQSKEKLTAALREHELELETLATAERNTRDVIETTQRELEKLRRTRGDEYTRNIPEIQALTDMLKKRREALETLKTKIVSQKSKTTKTRNLLLKWD